MSLSVLAVDDSRTMRDMLNYAMTREGITTHFAEDGLHGLEVLRGISPDVIITDINMPNLDGFGFIAAVRAQAQLRVELGQVPILVLTTESASDLKQRARDAGATGWVIKPFDAVKLIKALRLVAG